MLIWSKLSTFLHFEELFGNKQEFSVIEKKKKRSTALDWPSLSASAND